MYNDFTVKIKVIITNYTYLHRQKDLFILQISHREWNINGITLRNILFYDEIVSMGILLHNVMLKALLISEKCSFNIII